jgi:aspartate/methionine/tyrosine aminotransferase
MPIRDLLPFTLEDFFDEYEHRDDLINLASSDGLPWSIADLQRMGVAFPSNADTILSYPNVHAVLVPGLRRFCGPPPEIGILPTSGAAEAIALVMHELSTTDGDKDARPIGIPQPAFGAFRGLASMLGINTETYDYHPSRRWTPDVNEILGLAAHCRALIIINPHNPTGYVIPHDLLVTISNHVALNGGTLIVNEVFRTPDDAESAIQLGSHLVVMGSFSKIYGLPGLRLGWVAANSARLERLRTVQQYLTLSLSAMTVALGAAILSKPEDFSRAALIRKNRQIVKEWASQHGDTVSISSSAGGTTACLTFNTAMEESKLFEAFVRAGVLLVPGGQSFKFGPKLPWFRLGYGTDSGRVRRGLDLISTVIATLRH